MGHDAKRKQAELSTNLHQGMDQDSAIADVANDVPSNYQNNLRGTPQHLGGFSVSKTPGRIDQ